MSNAELPRSVDPYKFAEQRRVLEGVIPLRALSRLSECILEPGSDESCRVALQFRQDQERRRIVTGEVEVSVVVECQRCMQPMEALLSSQFSLGFVTSDEQAKQLPKELEPYQAADFSADLWELVEDELLLVLPPFPKHERNECPASEELAALEPDSSSAKPDEGKRENPFRVLADLKAKKH